MFEFCDQEEEPIAANIEDVSKVLEMAELDLDDDVFVSFQNGSQASLYEIYKIAERQGPIEFNSIGSWSEINGLQLTDTPKWYRRGDLKV